MEQTQFLQRESLQILVDVLTAAGHRCFAPQVRDGAIVYDLIDSVAKLPVGVHDQQSPGKYSLEHSQSQRYFAWANGPQALKPLLFSAREVLWRAERDAEGHIQFVQVKPAVQKTAVIGVRSCDLAAMNIQDQVFLEQQYQDENYQARRDALFTVAVNCSHPADTCFCASTGDGPLATSGYDLLLTELDDGFLIKSGSEAGQQIMAQLPLEQESDQQHFAAGEQALHAEQIQTRKLPQDGLAEKLLANFDHPRWQEVAERCLACGNCTMVCPTCFCHKETEQPQLDGHSTEHLREWDSCFTQGHSYIHGVVIRDDTEKRYRQWLSHKLATWLQQFGNSGCVGCGRCISWCPAAIDLTEETNAIAGGEND